MENAPSSNSAQSVHLTGQRHCTCCLLEPVNYYHPLSLWWLRTAATNRTIACHVMFSLVSTLCCIRMVASERSGAKRLRVRVVKIRRSKYVQLVPSEHHPLTRRPLTALTRKWECKSEVSRAGHVTPADTLVARRRQTAEYAASGLSSECFDGRGFCFSCRYATYPPYHVETAMAVDSRGTACARVPGCVQRCRRARMQAP